jgi:hypothetical protein
MYSHRMRANLQMEPRDRQAASEAGAKLVTFETQLRVDSAWRTDAIFNDRPSAVSAAERILAGRRTPAVRVIQVLYDPKLAECTEHTVFRATSFDEENQRARKRVVDQEMFEWGADGRRRRAPPPRPRKDWAIAVVFALALVGAALLWRLMR